MALAPLPTTILVSSEEKWQSFREDLPGENQFLSLRVVIIFHLAIHLV